MSLIKRTNRMLNTCVGLLVILIAIVGGIGSHAQAEDLAVAAASDTSKHRARTGSPPTSPVSRAVPRRTPARTEPASPCAQCAPQVFHEVIVSTGGRFAGLKSVPTV